MPIHYFSLAIIHRSYPDKAIGRCSLGGGIATIFLENHVQNPDGNATGARLGRVYTLKVQHGDVCGA